MKAFQNKLAAINTIKHFVSRDALHIRVLDGEIIGLLVGSGLVNSPVDLFYLKNAESQLLTMMNADTVSDILLSIEKVKETTLTSFLFALNIPMIGAMSSKRLAMRFITIDAVMTASTNDMLTIRHMGNIAIKNVHNFFAQENNRQLISDLLKAGIVPKGH